MTRYIVHLHTHKDTPKKNNNNKNVDLTQEFPSMAWRGDIRDIDYLEVI